MKHLTYAHQNSIALVVALWVWVHARVAALVAPNGERPHRVNRPRRWVRVLQLVAVVLAVLVEVLALFVLGYMIDLCLSLMELWAELARKHLELTV
jgi:nitrogen fixation/metabolism regulation signal transduction histidine kinase